MEKIISYIKELQKEYYFGTPTHTVLRKLEVELPGLFPENESVKRFKESIIKDLLLTIEDEKHVIENSTDYVYQDVQQARTIYNTIKNAVKIIERRNNF